MATLTDLRQQHPVFFYDSATFQIERDTLTLTFGYHLQNGPAFTTTLSFPDITPELLAQKDPLLLEAWVAQIGMIEGLSYWKTTCAPKWVVTPQTVVPEQLSFWKEVIQKGMSEFFFVNGIDGWQADFITFALSAQASAQYQRDQSTHLDRALTPIGGGKDSVVTTELLRGAGIEQQTFSINLYPQLRAVADIFWESDRAAHHTAVTRTLDPKLVELNAAGYLNGHTPFSAMVAFISTFAAYLYDYHFVPLSNEWSANEGNTIFLGHEINHQYSKSYAFEQLFQEYHHRWLSETIEYFSFLRPAHELQIAELFTTFPKYHATFLSCNRGQKTGTWCGVCPKCVFVAVLLSAFLPYEKVQKIFHRDILNDRELLHILDELAGFTEVKSLECVGTRDETIAAITLAMEKQSPPPTLVQYAWDTVTKSVELTTLRERAQKLRTQIQSTHQLPHKYFQILERAIKHLHQSSDQLLKQ